jgi:hypothetical protein
VNVGPSTTRPIVPAHDCYVTTPNMAAATQTARTSPPNSKMTSPKDSKGTLPVVTKTEGECPISPPPCSASAAQQRVATASSFTINGTLLSPLPFIARASRHLLNIATMRAPLTMSSPEPAEVKTDTKEIRKCTPA